MVYDTTTSSFWFHNDSTWVQIGTASNSWKLTGNSGTDTTVNFIGTTDAKPLRFKVNNEKAASLDYNPAIGNVSFGYLGLSVNTTAYGNAAYGYEALYSDTSGSENTADGYQSLYSNTGGNSNTANGYQSLYSNTIGTHNTANGYQSLFSNTTGFDNSATGTYALFSNTKGQQNTANGDYTLYSNIMGYNNTAIGYGALNSNTGNSNTANGESALFNNTIGESNTADGSLALENNTTGNQNAAVGNYALAVNTTGNQNTASGFSTLFNNITGNNNTAFGYNADVSTGGLSNATVIGSDAVVDDNNKVRIGNSSVTIIEGQVPFTTPSDGRFKTNITENVKGLDFILKLRPVIYNFQTKKYNDFIRSDMHINPKSATKDFSESESIRQSGFIAQEVEKAAKDAEYDFNGIIAPKNAKQTYSLAYSQFVVPIVKAVQEQQQIIETQKNDIDALKAQVAKLTQAIDTLKNK